MSISSPVWPITNTDHGVLVAFGEFLLQHGLLERLRQAPVPQKTHTFSPHDKLIDLLIGIMSGINGELVATIPIVSKLHYNFSQSRK